MTAEDITDAFATLRTICDPRGHGLLDALERCCLLDNAAAATFSRFADDLRELEEAPADNLVARIGAYGRGGDAS